VFVCTVVLTFCVGTDIPEDELITILEKRCGIPPSYCQKMVAVMKELQKRRQRSSIFAGKKGFITPRDLFRWADRQPQSYQQLAEDGYMLLGEVTSNRSAASCVLIFLVLSHFFASCFVQRLRTDDEKATVKEVLEKHIGKQIQTETMYSQKSVDQLSAMLTASALASTDSKSNVREQEQKLVRRHFPSHKQSVHP
jgi:midasin